ncbi:hypothetical protein GJAV_G00253740 [Gymnothorax javanicus]|nr:hypothetical protein GJAV_G00253740 [Gymnothorax javanicus]
MTCCMQVPHRPSVDGWGLDWCTVVLIGWRLFSSILSLCDSSQLTLDSNTVYEYLRLSEGNREVTDVEQIQSYPDHPERFDCWAQVLCREGLSGRCYWEAEWSGGVSIAVSYKEISRKGGGDCGLGRNNKSWALRCSHSYYSFLHNSEETEIPVPSSSRIGVYLDHRAGTLSFYSVSDTMTLLHRVQTTFTQPLYPGFGLNYGSSVKLCDSGMKQRVKGKSALIKKSRNTLK